MAQKQSKRRSSAKSSKTATNYWSGDVTRHSNALDLDAGVFTWDDPAKIAGSLKRSAERATGAKSDPFRSAMSMLTFYINELARICPKSAGRCSGRRKTNCGKRSGGRQIERRD